MWWKYYLHLTQEDTEPESGWDLPKVTQLAKEDQRIKLGVSQSPGTPPPPPVVMEVLRKLREREQLPGLVGRHVTEGVTLEMTLKETEP